MPTSLNPITQNDKIIATAVENNFNFLLTNFQSATAPSNPSNGQLWYDSTNSLLKVYNLGTTTWLTVGPASSSTTVTVADTPPGSPSSGDLWFDTGTTLRLYVYTTASGGAWLDANPAAAGGSAADGGIPNQQIFQASGTFTVPVGVTRVYVYAFGAGGGGGGGSQAYGGSTTGGNGGSGVALVTGLTPGASIVVTVGSGGNGGNATISTFTNGGAGGTSSFGSYVTATGGGGGSRGDLNIPGAAGTFTTTGTIIQRNSPFSYGGAGAGGTGIMTFACGVPVGGGGGGFTGGGGGAAFNSPGAGGGSTGFGNVGNNGGTVNGGAGGGPNGGTGGTGEGSYYGAGGGGGGGGGIIVRW